MKLTDRQMGGAVEAIIISVLSVVLVGALGFIFWQNVLNKDSDNTSTVQELSKNDTKTRDNKPNEAKNTEATTVDLNKWGVSFTMDSSNIQFNYVDEYGGYYDVVTRIENCYPSMPYLTSLGRINRWSKDGEEGYENAVPYASVGNYNFGYATLQQSCGDPGTTDGRKANETQESLSNKVKTALTSLKESQ